MKGLDELDLNILCADSCPGDVPRSQRFLVVSHQTPDIISVLAIPYPGLFTISMSVWSGNPPTWKRIPSEKELLKVIELMSLKVSACKIITRRNCLELHGQVELVTPKT